MTHLLAGGEALVRLVAPGLEPCIQITTHHHLSWFGGLGVIAVQLNGDQFQVVAELNLSPFESKDFPASHAGPITDGGWYFRVLWQGVAYFDEGVP
jgi:hypothetical protein